RTIEVDLFVANRLQPVQISVTTSASRPVFHQLIVVDLSDLKKTEHLLQESLANWYSLVHNAPDTILTVDTSGKMFFVNKPLWGYSSTELIGSSILDLLSDKERQKVLNCLDRTFRSHKRVICDVTGINGDDKRWYQFSFGSPHGFERDSVGLPTTTTTTTTTLIREISESKHAEASLRSSGEQLRDFAARLEAVREEERTRVAREIHDELGHALTALKMDLSWLQSKTDGVSETRKKLKACIRQVDDTIERVRQISSELRPSVLDNLGIIAAIEWEVS